jgi:hypothetical protein
MPSTFTSDCWHSMYPAMSDLNNSAVFEVPAVDCSRFQASTPSQIAGSISFNIIYQILSLITIWRVIILLLVLGNIKNIPLIWHVSIFLSTSSSEQLSNLFIQLRIVNAFRFCLRTQRPKVAPTADQLFQPLITTSHAPIMEIDFNLHSENSSNLTAQRNTC